MRSPEEILIHLAESRLQLFATTRSAGPESTILQTTTLIWSKMHWNRPTTWSKLCISNLASRCQARDFWNFERAVLITMAADCVLVW